jgi:hypothetical protein
MIVSFMFYEEIYNPLKLAAKLPVIGAALDAVHVVYYIYIIKDYRE